VVDAKVVDHIALPLVVAIPFTEMVSSYQYFFHDSAETLLEPLLFIISCEYAKIGKGWHEPHLVDAGKETIFII
jgi:hypothetical protein